MIGNGASPTTRRRRNTWGDALRELAAHGAVRIHRRASTGGIVTASNDAAALATGEFVVLLDHDDLLAPEALEVVAARLDEHDDVDYLYTDEDKIAADSCRFFDRFEKPDWSPERLRGQNYCSHLSVVRRSLFESIGRFREGFDGSQDYDLILRVTEQARRIEHVDEVLYHWRAVEGSAADRPRRQAVCVRRGTPGARRTLRSRRRSTDPPSNRRSRTSTGRGTRW